MRAFSMLSLSLLVVLVTTGAVGPAAAEGVEASGPPPVNLASLDLPLTVHEVAGVQRSQDVCSTGVPLPCGLFHEPQGIALFDPSGKAVPAQFRVLERWREKGEEKADLSVRWLLVTFLADVPPGGKSVYRLRAGDNPPPPQPVTAEDTGNAWKMGTLAFAKDFSGPLRLVFTDPEGKPITAGELPVTWSVWETGPVRACLKAESPTVPGRFGFIAWIYAYAGQRRWDMTVVLKNTPNEAQGPLYFMDFSVVWEPPEVRGDGDFLLGGQWGHAIAGKTRGGEPACLHQESDGTDYWNTFGKDWRMSPVLDWTEDKSKAKAGLPAFRGYKATVAGQELGRGDFAAGWAALQAGHAWAFAAVRDYYQQYPKATEVAAGRIVVRLWPANTRWQSQKPGRRTSEPLASDGSGIGLKSFGGLHWLDDCTRKWHDLSFRLGSERLSAEQAEAYSRALDAPLLAHPPAEWCRAAGGFRPLPEHAAEKEFAGTVVKAQTGTGRNWVNFGGDVTDQIRRRYHGADLGGFARTGDPLQAYRLYQTGRHSSGMTPLWLDDYQYPRDVGKLTHAQYCGLARPAGKYRPGTWHHGYMCWNDAHFCCQEVFDNWRLLGDPLALDALTTIGRWCQAYVDFREANPDKLVAGTRADGLPLHNLCEAYRILGDESMRRSLDRFADVCWKQVNKDRGNYGVMDSWEGGKDRCEKPFMMAQVIKGLRGHWELTGDERTADQIYGMADFILAESSLGPWGFNYVVMMDPGKNPGYLAAKRAEAQQNGKHVSYGDLAWVMAWVHRRFGDERFRAVIDAIDPKAYPYVSRSYTGYYPDRSKSLSQSPGRRTSEPVASGSSGIRCKGGAPEAVKDLAAEALGGGKVRLSWTAPAGGPVCYQVKWAARPMVERIPWPDEKDVKANWWAANHVAGEPRPGAAGTKESMVVENVPAGRCCFAVRSFDAASNRSAIGNLAELVVR